jgi:hypothetical protein
MNKQFLIVCIFYLFLFNSLFSQLNQDTSVSDISLRTFVENESVALNREVIYIIQLSWEGELSRYKISEVLDPDVTNLIIRGSGSSNKVITNPDGKEISIKKITFYFKPIEMGMAYINGVTVRYEDSFLDRKESLLASRISIKVVDPILDSSSNNFFQYILYIIILIVIALAVFLLALYNKRKKENELRELENIKETTEEKYLRLLKETIHLAGNNYEEKLNDLTHLILGFFSEKYSISLLNMSSNDILKYFENRKMEQSIFSKIEEFISKSDLIRFAGNNITETEFHQLYDSVEWMLVKCKNDKSEKEGE